jgi:RTX toxin acyltransferase family
VHSASVRRGGDHEFVRLGKTIDEGGTVDYSFRVHIITNSTSIAGHAFIELNSPTGTLTLDAEVETRLAAGTTRLRPQDWKSGDRLWVVEVIAPFGGAGAMVQDLKAKVFPERS